MVKTLIERLSEEITPAQFKALAKSMTNGRLHLLYYVVGDDQEDLLIPFFEKHLHRIGATLKTKKFSSEELLKEYGFSPEQFGGNLDGEEGYIREVVTIYSKEEPVIK